MSIVVGLKVLTKDLSQVLKNKKILNEVMQVKYNSLIYRAGWLLRADDYNMQIKSS